MRPENATLTLLFAALTGVGAIFLTLAPLGLAPESLPGPHFLLIVLLFWSARRPSATPPLLVFALGLLADLVRDGPIGAELLALLVVTEALRGLARRRPAFGLLEEVGRFAVAAAVFHAIAYTLLAISYAGTPGLSVILAHFAVTVVAYPLVSLCLRRLFGVRADDFRFGHLSARSIGR